jgi:anaerobic magnesium-protoporphyrin IX monomethyl ester cyclase
MSLGHPGESQITVDDTREWLLQVKPDDFDVTIITIYPGTPYFDDSVCVNGRDIYAYTAPNGDQLFSVHTDHLRDVNFYKGVPGAYQSFVWTDDLSRHAIVEARDAVERDVRTALKIPWPTAPAALQLEHSMGMR